MNNSTEKIQTLSVNKILNWIEDMSVIGSGILEIRFIPDSFTLIPPSKKCIRFRLNNSEHTAQTEMKLRERGLKILKLASEGLTGKEIADILNVSLSVVKKEKSRIFTELEVINIRAAITKARMLGLIP